MSFQLIDLVHLVPVDFYLTATDAILEHLMVHFFFFFTNSLPPLVFFPLFLVLFMSSCQFGFGGHFKEHPPNAGTTRRQQ